MVQQEDVGPNLKNRLLDKSQEMFLIAVELFNRPSIRYHAEGCAIFLCSSWELMLKAHLLERDGYDALFYKDSKRTLSLETCLRRIFTNEYDPLRKNMEKVIELRNTSTHFITLDYEFLYGPILQACVNNYVDKLETLHNRRTSDFIPANYLNLAVTRTPIDQEQVRAKYDAATFEKLVENYNSIAVDGEESNERYSAFYRTELCLVKIQRKPI